MFLVPDGPWTSSSASSARSTGGGAQGRKRRMPPGDQLGALAVLPEQLDGLLDRFGPFVVERRRDHCPSPPFAERIARHTRSGVHGRSMSVMPNGARASITALTTAGGDAMVPVSPTPFTPSSFVVEGSTAS